MAFGSERVEDKIVFCHQIFLVTSHFRKALFW